MMMQVFYFEQYYHDINILDCNYNIVMVAKRDVNWLGKIKTVIENKEVGRIVGTFSKKIFFNTFNIIDSSNKLKIQFLKNKRKLQIENCVITQRNANFIGSVFYILVNDLEICKVSVFDFFKISNHIKYKIEFLNEFSNFEYIFIYLCLTEDTLFS